jgi:Protein of unknown function (DUF1592)/Protein of unknown function (DUF1588)/Protein of unknown function (DUF1587)/Protein of unknown function (DUF1595)/Protein of unknown function (DUF1585)
VTNIGWFMRHFRLNPRCATASRGIATLALAAAAAFGQTNAFQDQLYPVLKNAGCPTCHNSNGVASATRLHFPDAAASNERVEAFGRSLVRFVDREHPDQSLLLKKPTRRIPHAGGERIKPASPEEGILVAWIKFLAAMPAAELNAALKYDEADAPSERRLGAVLRRLTNSQYNNTVRDLLGDQTAPANEFPPEDFVSGFKDQYDAQNLSPLLEEAYGNAAEKLARNAFRNGDTHHLIPCPSGTPCAERFVQDFGRKAFRRPLTTLESRRYLSLFAKEKVFSAGAQLVLEAMLQSPNFLFRLDETTNPALKPYAAASRLAFSLWDSTPDAALLDAAARGELASATQIESAARRMLKDPRAHQALDEYVAEWLRFDRILTSSRDRRRYPKFSRETAVAMTEEARMFVSDLVWNDRDFMDAFRASYGFVNADLASVYGVPPPAQDFARVDFTPQSERAGLLGQALFLALSAKPEDTSLTGRGLFVREQFLCQHVPPPPAGVNTNLTPSTEAHPQTNRERMGEHASNQFCATCHNLIDPIGVGFEKFDAVGARRDDYKLVFYGGHQAGHRQPPKSVNLTIDTKGFVAGIPDSNFTSPRELGIILAKTPLCQECMVKQYFRYVTGRAETPADAPLVRKVLEDFRQSNFHFQELMISLVRNRELLRDERNVYVASNHQAP